MDTVRALCIQDESIESAVALSPGTRRRSASPVFQHQHLKQLPTPVARAAAMLAEHTNQPGAIEQVVRVGCRSPQHLAGCVAPCAAEQ